MNVINLDKFLLIFEVCIEVYLYYYLALFQMMCAIADRLNDIVCADERDRNS
ncbi:MAG: hypothetical protein QNJ54_00275 [Prochloraceae cyanobacterium]|nr:hypothetical protein [Prochloraceae cyanobacterium]